DKTVVNDNGGTAVADDFNLTLDGDPVLDGALNPVAPGAHTSGETNLQGYSAGDWGGHCDLQGAVTVGLGEIRSCTITNDDIQPKLTVTKTVVNDHGGSAFPDDFALNVNATSVLSGVQNGFNAGAYTVSETSLPTYTAGVWGGDCAANGAITLLPGDEKTCTITNDDIAPELTVIKHVVNDNGGTKVAGDFTMSVGGTEVSDDSFSGSETGTTVTLDAGEYNVDEIELPGYAKSLGADCVGAINIGEKKTCTITNDDIAPELTLVKVLVNDNDGTSVVTDWTLIASGSVNLLSGTSGVTSGPTFGAGIYALSETSAVTGYSASGWSCTGSNNLNGALLTIGLAEKITCTITNNDNAPKLHLRKVVVNDNGGTAVASDFTLTADGVKANNDISGAGSVDSGPTLKADTWTLSENNLPGYIASEWVCVGGTQQGSNITLKVGEEATCTITNDDTPGHFTGGGSVFVPKEGIMSSKGTSKNDRRVTHGFTLHCNTQRLPNRLEVNWGSSPKDSHKFHLETLLTAQCWDNPNIDPRQTRAEIDTIQGSGVGRYDGVSGATINFTFDDAGEPGKNDTARMVIKDKNGVTVLDTYAALKLDSGNQQAHQDN
ncbi:MAG: hypothetical protein RIQ56_270, partial [Candidatus Parcubacteria bacterium]